MAENLTGKITDLLRLSEERKTQSLTVKRGSNSPSRPNTMSERPPSRAKINSLELELEEKVRLVLDSSSLLQQTNEFGMEFTYEPQRETLRMTQEKILQELGCQNEDLTHEQWLTMFIKFEFLRHMCDEINGKFTELLSINSTELGSVSRKLRLTYKQAYDQMKTSWIMLHEGYQQQSEQLIQQQEIIEQLTQQLHGHDQELQRKYDLEITRLNSEFQLEKQRDLQAIQQAEFKMDQMSDTLKYLNGIFRTMQNDTNSLKHSDLVFLCNKLEHENKELKKQANQLDNCQITLSNVQQLNTQQKQSIHELTQEINRLTIALQRRDEVVNNLMERETIRNAELIKLQQISKMKEEELMSLDMKDAATSVLCIRCKRSLDDLSNIRQIILQDTSNNPHKLLTGEYFRILLPNIKNQKPFRSMVWLHGCIRSILIAKMKEELGVRVLPTTTHSTSSLFASYVYAWFNRTPNALGTQPALTGNALLKLFIQCDEDRWGFYYGLKINAKEDVESSFFWYLLTEEQCGPDTIHFILYCLSLVMSLSGIDLWKQFGYVLRENASIEHKINELDEKLPANIWLDIDIAKDAVKRLLTKSLNQHLQDALDAIDALKVTPDDLIAKTTQAKEAESVHFASNQDQESKGGEGGAEDTIKSPKKEEKPKEPTHINLFLWLRIMLQQFHADQVHRDAAIRLMFETASVGALTPAIPSYGSNGGKESGGSFTSSSHVEYPQFQSICRTLFPHMSITQMATFYTACHQYGRRRVSADVFISMANLLGHFTAMLNLPTIPLLDTLNGQYITLDPTQNAILTQTAGEDTTMYTMNVKTKLQSKLATIVHRKLAGIDPLLQHILSSMPEPWSAFLRTAMDQTYATLNDNFAQLKKVYANLNSTPNEDGSLKQTMEMSFFLDGIQPYLSYRRLLSMFSLCKSLNENPFLPTEIFSAKEMNNTEEGIRVALCKVDNLLTQLENSLVTPYMILSGETLLPHLNINNNPSARRVVKKYHNFEIARKALLARRLQLVIKKFLSKDVPIPRPVRKYMAAGYLLNLVNQHANSNAMMKAGNKAGSPRRVSAKASATSSLLSIKSLPLKFREVYHEPWWGQIHIAGIYYFKLQLDARASLLGLAPISLAQSVSAYFYHMLGSTEVAERCIQDLFVCIKSYRFGITRLRLFSVFLGDGRDLEENVVEVMQHPHALSVYFYLLLCIHEEMETHLSNASKTASASYNALYRLVENKRGTYIASRVLFPSSESPFTRSDKRELWLLPVNLLTNVARRWSQFQPWLQTNSGTSLYTEIPEKLAGSNTTDSYGRVDVDDFLWVMMVQWAKLEAWHLLRSVNRGNLIEKSFPTNFGNKETSTHNEPGKQIATKGNDNDKDNANEDTNTTKRGVLSRRMSLLPLSNLKSMVESIYRPGEADNIADLRHYAAAYIQCIRSRRVNPPVPLITPSSENLHSSQLPTRFIQDGSEEAQITRKSMILGKLDTKFGSELHKLLQECVLWDTNLCIFNAHEGHYLEKNKAHMTIGHQDSTSMNNQIQTKAMLLSTSLDPNESSSALIFSSKHNLQDENNEEEKKTENIFPRSTALQLIELVNEAVHPELLIATSKSMFYSYQAVIQGLLERIGEDPKYNDEIEVRQRVQAIRIHLLTISDFFQQKCEMIYISPRLYNLEQRISIEEDEEHILNLWKERNHYTEIMEIAWNKLQSLISSIAELAVMTQQEFPRDSWSVGAKMHVDRAYVYSIHTKNSLL